MHEKLGNLLTSTGQNRILTFLIQLQSQVMLTLKHYSQMCHCKDGETPHMFSSYTCLWSQGVMFSLFYVWKRSQKQGYKACQRNKEQLTSLKLENQHLMFYPACFPERQMGGEWPGPLWLCLWKKNELECVLNQIPIWSHPVNPPFSPPLPRRAARGRERQEISAGQSRSSGLTPWPRVTGRSKEQTHANFLAPERA